MDSDGLIELEITSLAYGGRGIGRLDGKVYFVLDAVEGDIVKARITEDKKRYANADLVSFVRKSPLRSPPACAFMERCGGCQWMGIPYENQIAWKRQFIKSALTRIGKISDDLPIEVFPSPSTTSYRNRVLLRMHIDDKGAMRCGYFARGSRDLVPIDRCAIASEAINAIIATLHASDLSPFSEIKIRTEFQELPHGSGKVAVTVYPGEGSRDAVKGFVALLKTFPAVTWAGLVFDLHDAPLLPLDQQLDIQFQTIPGQFQQVNVAHNQNLRTYIQALVEERKPSRVLDVFCGSGNLSLGLAQEHRYIEGIEANKVAIACAKKIAAQHSLQNTVYLAGDAEKHMWKVSKSGEAFDLVILDPPRQGFFRGMVPLKNLSPKTIIYVSCDPTTLARDLGYLCRDEVYKITSVVGFDFFPNTYHVETVVLLERD